MQHQRLLHKLVGMSLGVQVGLEVELLHSVVLLQPEDECAMPAPASATAGIVQASPCADAVTEKGIAETAAGPKRGCCGVVMSIRPSPVPETAAEAR